MIRQHFFFRAGWLKVTILFPNPGTFYDQEIHLRPPSGEVESRQAVTRTSGIDP